MYNLIETLAKTQGFFGFVVWKSYCECDFQCKTILSCIHAKKIPNMINRQTKCPRYHRFASTQFRTEPKYGLTCLVVFSIEITTGEGQRIPRISSECAQKHGYSVKDFDYFSKNNSNYCRKNMNNFEIS